MKNVTNVIHKTNKHPLPLFFGDLEPDIQSNAINKLTYLLHTKIKVEEPYKAKFISQCFNCQDYGHTRAYCGYPSIECTKPRVMRDSSQMSTGNDNVEKHQPPKVTSYNDNIKHNVNNYNEEANHPLSTSPEKNIAGLSKTYA